jgi:hypothetical protein
VFTETKHEGVGDAGSNEGMEAAIAKWVVDEQKASDQRIDMTSCKFIREVVMGLVVVYGIEERSQKV